MHGGVVGCVRLQLKVARQVELDFMSRLGVYRKRPRTWATDRGIPVIPTKWVDVNKGDAKQPESIEIVRGNTSAYTSLSALEHIGNLMDKIAKTEHPKWSGHATQ